MKLEKIINLYGSVGKRKGYEYLFRWLYDIYSKISLPCIDFRYKEILANDKTKLAIFDVLVDDLADKIRNKKLLELFIQIPWDVTKRYQNKYLEVGKIIWKSCITSIRKYPRYREFKEIFYFDLQQVLNSMKYSFLVNTFDIGNPVENKIYSHHGCMVILHCDMDLMCSPEFDKAELWKLRPVFYHMQKICHIGNMLNTYPREIIEKDFSSPIISLGIRKGLITKKDVIENPENALKKLKKLEVYFKKEVRKHLREIRKYVRDIESVDLGELPKKLEIVFNCFLERRRYWEED